jgi:hypothetical protein
LGWCIIRRRGGFRVIDGIVCWSGRCRTNVMKIGRWRIGRKDSVNASGIVVVVLSDVEVVEGIDNGRYTSARTRVV